MKPPEKRCFSKKPASKNLTLHLFSCKAGGQRKNRLPAQPLPTQTPGQDRLGIASRQFLPLLHLENSYTITVQALVKNKGESDDVIIEVAAVDKEGYQLKTLKLNGFVAQGQKKLLIGRLTMSKAAFEQTTDWERLQ